MMSEQRNWRELMDACRPHRTDLQSAEFAPLRELIDQDKDVEAAFEKSQHVDAQVQEQLHQVEVPAGMSERLLDGLRHAKDQVSELADEPPSRYESVRWRTLAGIALALAATVLLMMVVWPRPRLELTASSDELENRAQGWPAVLSHQWHSLDVPAPRNLPDPFPLPMRALHWQLVDLDVLSDVVCFELELGQSASGYLFVLPAGSSSVRATSPPRNPAETQSRCVGVWRDDDSVFVFVFEGPVSGYRQLLERAPTMAI